MKIGRILSIKGHKVLSVVPETVLPEAIRIMVEQKTGSLLVLDGTKIAGIVTERDILWTANSRTQNFDGITVQEIMLKKLVTCTPSSRVDEALKLMTHNFTGKRIRHLPVLEGGKLVGLVSMGDLVHGMLQESQFENQLLKNYIKNWPEKEQG